MSDIPSSSWCTNWEAYNTPRLWAMVAGEDDPEAWKQVIAWQEVSDAVDSHLARLKQAQETLETAWPTSQSEASRAFATRLNTLITRMEGAREEASSTSTALDHILQALRQAKQSIEPLWKQYRDKNEDVVPAWWDNAEEELDAKARAHMIAAERVVQQYVPGIRVPDAYEFVLSSRLEDDERGVPTGAGSSSVADGEPPGGSHGLTPHNPPPPSPAFASSISAGVPTAGGSETSSRDFRFLNSDPPDSSLTQPPLSQKPTTMLPPLGPELSEVPSSPSPPPVSSLTPPTLSPPITNLPLPPEVIPRPSQVSVGRASGALPGARLIGGLQPFKTGPASVMPSGAVIGTPAGKQNVGSARSAWQTAMSPRPAWLPASGSGSAETAGAGMPVGGVRNRTDSEDKGIQFDPDNPWMVSQGVAPVIEPPDELAVHDPGRGVIGRYR